MVEAFRGGPIPDEYKKDEDLKNAYYAGLDQALDRRKTRGSSPATSG